MENYIDIERNEISPLEIACARYVLGTITGLGLKEIVDSVIAGGTYCESFGDLIMEKNPPMSDAAPKFERGLKELNITLPTTEEAVVSLALYHLKNILNKKISAEDGVRYLCSDIYNGGANLLTGLEFLQNETFTWPYRAIIEYNDIAAGELGNDEERKERLRSELNKEVLAYARKWMDQICKRENGPRKNRTSN